VGLGRIGPSEIVNDHCGIRKEISHVVNTSHGVNGRMKNGEEL
jgi:hypothetical protein